eukprot:scaffold14727_cov201-Ochromonas_danica.AAC.2
MSKNLAILRSVFSVSDGTLLSSIVFGKANSFALRGLVLLMPCFDGLIVLFALYAKVALCQQLRRGGEQLAMTFASGHCEIYSCFSQCPAPNMLQRTGQHKLTVIRLD